MSDTISPTETTSHDAPTPSRGIPVAEPVASIPPSLTQPPSRVSGLLHSPQFWGAVITGVISLAVAIVGIVPSLLELATKNNPTPTVAALLVTFTPSAQASDTATPNPTSVSTEQPTETPMEVALVSTEPLPVTPLPVLGATATPQPTSADSASTPEPNMTLYFDNASFTIRNPGRGRKSLTGVVFVGGGGRWEASRWGPIYSTLTNRDCLRLRDQNTGQRNPPAECEDLLALLLVGSSAIFWRDDNGFRIEQDGVTLATCTKSPCEVYIPQR